jgi:MOSC domain-containing protein YiiM
MAYNIILKEICWFQNAIYGAKFYGTGDCKPCKKIENLLGKKMLDAMQGMGGITASVIQSGEIKINDNLNMEINK